jgi:hypothetical protein
MRWHVAAQRDVFLKQPSRGEAAGDGELQRLGGDGLDQVVLGAALDGADGRSDLVQGRDHYHAHFGVAAAQLSQDRHAVHPGHDQIRDHDVEVADCGCVEGRLGRGDGLDLEAGPREVVAVEATRKVLVVDEEDPAF